MTTDRQTRKFHRTLIRNTKTQVAAIESAERKKTAKANQIVLSDSTVKRIVLAGLVLIVVTIGASAIFGTGEIGAPGATSTSTPAPASATPAEGVTNDARTTSCAQWRGMSASDQSAMASSIIASEQAGGHAKGMASTWLAANITASCGGSNPSTPAGVSNSTVGQMAALIIYDMTVDPHAESEAASPNAEAKEGEG